MSEFFKWFVASTPVGHRIERLVVREDERISLLSNAVGPVVFQYTAERTLHVRLLRVPMDVANRKEYEAYEARTVQEHTLRALNPRKIAVLRRHVLPQLSLHRVVVFCDIIAIAMALHTTLLKDRCMLLSGRMSADERQTTLNAFRDTPPGGVVLLCTRVADAAIDFPPGCVIVQFHITCGSRQQEIQRCGRGTRGTVDESARMIHLINNVETK